MYTIGEINGFKEIEAGIQSIYRTFWAWDANRIPSDRGREFFNFVRMYRPYFSDPYYQDEIAWRAWSWGITPR